MDAKKRDYEKGYKGRPCKAERRKVGKLAEQRVSQATAERCAVALRELNFFCWEQRGRCAGPKRLGISALPIH